MNLIVCVDQSFGMSFGGRRLSRDGEVVKKIAEMAEGKTLLMSEYSAPLFEGVADVKALPDFLLKAENADFCFVETNEIPIERIESIFLFCWNRDYPADVFFDREILSSFKKIKKEEFSGSSHKKITLEIYQRA